MASLSFDQTKNGYRLSFRKDNRKCSLWLGSISPAKAEDWKQHLEHLLDVADKEPPSKPTWLLISARTSRFAKLGQKMQSDGGYGWLHVEIAATRTGKAKQFFAEALERGLVDENPFRKLPSTTRGNEKRQAFIPGAWIEKCIEKAPNEQWRTILALARFGGLRICEQAGKPS